MVNEQKNKMSSTPHGHRPCPEVRVNRVGCVCALTRSSRARVSPTHQHCWPFRASHIRGHTHTNPCLRAPSAAFSCGYPSVSYQHVFLFGPHRPNHVSSTCPGSAPSVTLQSSCSVFVCGCPLTMLATPRTTVRGRFEVKNDNCPAQRGLGNHIGCWLLVALLGVWLW